MRACQECFDHSILSCEFWVLGGLYMRNQPIDWPQTAYTANLRVFCVSALSQPFCACISQSFCEVGNVLHVFCARDFMRLRHSLRAVSLVVDDALIALIADSSALLRWMDSCCGLLSTVAGSHVHSGIYLTCEPLQDVLDNPCIPGA